MKATSRLVSVTVLILININSKGSQHETSIDSLNKTAYNLLKSNPNVAIGIADKVLLQSVEIDYLFGQFQAYKIIGTANFDKGFLTESIEAYKNAMKVASSLGNTTYLAEAQLGLGNVLVDYGSNLPEESDSYREQAEDLYHSSLETSIANHDSLNLAKVYNQLGVLKGYQNMLVESSSLFKKAYEITSMLDDSILLTQSAQNIAKNYKMLEQYDSAIWWSYRSIDFQCDLCNELAAINYLNIGAAYYQVMKDDSAEMYYHKSLELSHKNGYQSIGMDAALNLLYFHSFLGDDDSVFKYLELYDKLNRYAKRNEKLQLFAQNQERFHTDELKTKAIQAQLAKERADKKQLIWKVMAGVVVLVGLVLFFVFHQRSKILKQDKLIATKKLESLLQTQEVKNLDAMLEGQNTERQRIAADLHDRLGSMLSAVKLHFGNVEEKIGELQKENIEQYAKATTLLDAATQEVRKIAHDMASGTLVKFGLNAALIELKQTITEASELQMNIYDMESNERLDVTIEIGVYRIVQELVSNILKHANATKVDVHLTVRKDELNVLVEDNGVGFDSDDMISQGQGLGLKNVKQRVQHLNGSVVFDAHKGKGTTVIIDIPIKRSLL